MNERCQSGCILLIDHADIWPALIFFMRQAPCERVFLLRQLILSHKFSCRLILSQELKERIFRSVSLLQTGCVIYGWTFRAPLLSRSKWNKNIQKKMSVLFAESFSCSLIICNDLHNDIFITKVEFLFICSSNSYFPLPYHLFPPTHYGNRLYLISLVLSLLLGLPFFFSSHLLPSLPFLFVPSSPSSLEPCAWHVLYLWIRIA